MPRDKTTTFAETIRQKLADDILHGVYPPGARLDEHGLAKRFNLSRTPVREALRQLTSAGLVEMRPRRGVIVSLPTDSALAEMFEVMGELEASCARLAAQRMSPAERVRLELVHQLSSEAVRRGDADQASDVMRTHVNVVAAASSHYVHGLELTEPGTAANAIGEVPTGQIMRRV